MTNNYIRVTTQGYGEKLFFFDRLCERSSGEAVSLAMAFAGSIQPPYEFSMWRKSPHIGRMSIINPEL